MKKKAKADKEKYELKQAATKEREKRKKQRVAKDEQGVQKKRKQEFEDESEDEMCGKRIDRLVSLINKHLQKLQKLDAATPELASYYGDL